CNADKILEHIASIQSPKIIHLACHGQASHSLLGALWLPGPWGSAPYSVLHYERILRIFWSKCEFIFINACFGASTLPFIGGSSLGIQEAFRICGAKQMIGALWPIDDNVAKNFALIYYSQLELQGDYLEAFDTAKEILSKNLNDYEMESLNAYVFLLL
ncbi:MAG TPA: CHAT domain-containing protein, partial [candidate division Zixibacteria bacterium]|nr:CHAT domain-containing protein [candidate division Zixibacteria bacterium]